MPSSSGPSSAPRSGPAATPPGDAVRATLVDGEIHLHVPYRTELVAGVRTLPGRRWDPKRRVWRVPDTAAAREAVLRVFGVQAHTPLPEGAVTTRPSPRRPADSERAREDVADSAPHHLERFDEEMRLRGYGARTRKAYLGHARRLLQDVGVGGDLVARLRAHVLGRLRDGGVSRSYHNQLISALRLFCSTVLGRRVEELPLARPRRERRLPTVLSQEEFHRFLAAVRNPNRCGR